MDFRRPRLSRIFLALVACLVVVPVPAFLLRAQDLISVLDADGQVLHKYQGQVVRWNADRLTYIGNGRERDVLTERIASVEYPRTPAHEQADRFFDEGRFDQATLGYENAIPGESRAWVVEELRARRLRCAAALGDVAEEITGFLAIVQANDRTRFFHLIPLAWQASDRISGQLAGELERWLAIDDPVRGLIAASWLLSSDSEAAETRLKKLAIAGDSRVAQLADAQLWRPRLIVSGAEELRRWNLAINRMPEPIQAGPRYLAAMLKKRLRGDDQAAVALLQVPILFPQQYQLCGAALAEAHGLLQSLGRGEEAVRVARELDQKYGASRAAAAMGNPVEKLGN